MQLCCLFHFAIILSDYHIPLYQQNIIEIFTEYKQNGVTYRAHKTIIHLENGMTKFESEHLDKMLPDNAEYGHYASDLYPAKVLFFQSR